MDRETTWDFPRVDAVAAKAAASAGLLLVSSRGDEGLPEAAPVAEAVDHRRVSKHLRNEIRALEAKLRGSERRLRLRTRALVGSLVLSGLFCSAAAYFVVRPPSDRLLTEVARAPAIAAALPKPAGPAETSQGKVSGPPAGPGGAVGEPLTMLEAPSPEAVPPALIVTPSPPPRPSSVEKAPARTVLEGPTGPGPEARPPEEAVPEPAADRSRSTAPTPSAGLPEGLPNYVLVHFPQKDARAAARATVLAQQLRKAGIAVADPTPTAQRSTEPGISYFFAKDQQVAAAVERVVGGPLGRRRLAALPKDDRLPRPGTLVISVASS